MQRAMILIQLLLLLFKSTESANTLIAKPGCPKTCEGSDILIPYPFGIGPDCALSEEFVLNCDNTVNNIRSPSRGLFFIGNISLSLGQARIYFGITSTCKGTAPTTANFSSNGQFRLNTEKNKFIVIGCNALAYLHLDNSSNYSAGCLSFCTREGTKDALSMHESCSGNAGIGCCQTDIPNGTSTFYATFDERLNNSKVLPGFSRCNYDTVAEAAEFQFYTYYTTIDESIANRSVPIVLDWAIGNTTCDDAKTNKSSYGCISDYSYCLNLNSSYGGYLCNCSAGYEGNPYLDAGCQDIDECAGQNRCSKQEKCHNLQGSYRCSCPFGWSNDTN